MEGCGIEGGVVCWSTGDRVADRICDSVKAKLGKCFDIDLGVGGARGGGGRIGGRQGVAAVAALSR